MDASTQDTMPPPLPSPPPSSDLHCRGGDLSYSLVAITPEDFAATGDFQALAFVDKRPRWCFNWLSSHDDTVHDFVRVYEQYLNECPTKLEHCCIVKDGTDGKVIGGCQLQLPGDPGDWLFQSEKLQHELSASGEEAYVEWIACHPDYTGRGIGTKLIEWAVDYCRQYTSSSSSSTATRINRLSLEVMSSNKGAVRLYERKGFVVTTQPGVDPCDQYFFAPCLVFFCLGCRYCSVIYMEKDLSMEETKTLGSENTPGAEEI